MIIEHCIVINLLRNGLVNKGSPIGESGSLSLSAAFAGCLYEVFGTVEKRQRYLLLIDCLIATLLLSKRTVENGIETKDNLGHEWFS